MFEVFSELNWLAIIVAAVVYFMLGAAWFTPIFGKTYDSATGVPRSKKQKWPLLYYVGPLASSVVATIATSLLVYALNITQLFDAIALGFIVGIGYAASVSINNAISPNMPRPLLYGAVTGGYHVVGIVLVAAIIFGMK